MKLFSDQAKAALESGETVVSAALALSLTDGSTFRAWGGHGVLTLGGNTYVGLGDDGFAQATGGALGTAAQNVELRLSGVDPEVAAAVDVETLRRAPAVIRRLIFDGTGTQLLDSHVFARGRVDTVSIEETPGGTSTISLQVESSAKSLGRAGGRMRTDADQRLIDADDPGLTAVSYAGQKTLYWGGKIPAQAAHVANGGAVSGGVFGGGQISLQPE